MERTTRIVSVSNERTIHKDWKKDKGSLTHISEMLHDVFSKKGTRIKMNIRSLGLHCSRFYVAPLANFS